MLPPLHDDGPRMRHWLLLLLVLPLAHCSCQRQPDAEATAAPPQDAAAAGGQKDAASTDTVAAAVAARAASNAAQQAASTLHAYLGVLPRADRSAADAFWSDGRPGSPAGDAVLRGVADLRGMRILNDAPKALDRESPPRAFEVPVRLRLDTGDGTRQLHGWYRLRARIDGQGWEITSASLQPVLD